jgi:hypothetical protein
MAGGSGAAQTLRYDPAADLAERYPEWRVWTADLDGIVPEVMSPRRKFILLEETTSAVVQRCSLAHAIAHIDLGHGWTLPGWFENKEESDADDLASRRLISLEDLARALTWSRDREEVAAELEVDLEMLEVRERKLTRDERKRLRRMLSRRIDLD